MSVGSPVPPARGIAAHRGGSAQYPENTLAAFSAAIDLGAAQIELDLRRTSDGHIVVIHDETVDRTTDGRGRVSELPLAELRRLDAGNWKGRQFVGERIPLLDEVLELAPADVWLNVQVKFREPLAADAARRIAAHGMLGQAFIACGNAAAREARSEVPDILICNLVRQASREAYLDHGRKTGANFIQLHHLRGIPTRDFVARAEEAGLRVNFMCEPGCPRLEALAAAGVHFPLVDDVAAATAVYGRRPEV